MLLFIPLAMTVFWPMPELQDRLLEHPAALEKLDSISSVDELCALFPNDRVPGAHLARHTWMHWLYAAIALFGYWALLSFSWRESTASPARLLVTGIITGTIGIFLLLAFQFLAFGTQGFWLRGRSIIVILFLIVKFIGYSYVCALDPDSSLLGSLMGFTFGVGLCEELCKALPIIYYLRDGEKTNWQGACLVGLASGIGFGVSEGIQYSADFYNGMSPGLIYLVRFLSCVGLHAVWSSGVALLMYANQDYLDEILSWEVFPMFLYSYLLLPMFLHGLYDTLLKKNMDVWALVVALGSFAWWLWVIGKIGTPVTRRRRRNATA
jgi:RsiW-degrading membrane proteinase PrsW (M82 family)